MTTAQLALPAFKDAFSGDTFERSLSTLHSFFPTTQEETRLQKARRIMGEELVGLSDEELEIHLTEFNFLLDSWFDQFEQGLFSGKTLHQLLREG
jgi:hypothetical protein